MAIEISKDTFIVILFYMIHLMRRVRKTSPELLKKQKYMVINLVVSN